MDGETCWTAVATRDTGADGHFVYAVRTTGVYCRPGCASRRPRRENVAFFRLPEAARAAGFRACLRCRPDAAPAADPQLALVRRAARLIEETLDAPLSLSELAERAGASPFHLHRLFRRHLGIAPKAYGDALRMRTVRRSLKEGEPIAGALYEAGFGSSSRLYERASAQLGMTPGQFRRGAPGEDIRYCLAGSPLGRLLVAATAKGVCFLALGEEDGRLVGELGAEFPRARLAEDAAGLGPWVEIVLAYLSGEAPHPALPLDLRGTAFQRLVWETLQTIPPGETTTYAALAARIGSPRAIRAVGRACATNPVSLAVPCHRVLRGDGALAGYRWGLARKRALIDREAARAGAEGVGETVPAAKPRRRAG